MIVVDTNVISRLMRREPHPAVLAARPGALLLHDVNGGFDARLNTIVSVRT